MKLNPDCVRDVLLYLEEHLEYSSETETSTRIKRINWSSLYDDDKLLLKYETNDIKYTIQKLFEAKYIDASISTGKEKGWLLCQIIDITWEGHEFLNKVRGQTIWEATKKQASKMGGLSVKTLGTIAMSVTQAIVTHQDFIQKIVDAIK